MGTEQQAKWVALVDDNLVPLPQRKVKAEVILQQAGIADGMVLVRDFNSPNDQAFKSSTIVDLAEGNVFRTASDCETHAIVTHAAPAKLAFVVDDRWEITIQPKQTGESLRGLFSIPEKAKLLRDYESPVDQPIDEGDEVKFVDGPVFITRGVKPHEITIIVEGTPHTWLKPKISYAEVATLFDPNYPQHPEITYSITYKRGPSQKPEGILPPGASVSVVNKMVFNVSPTGQS